MEKMRTLKFSSVFWLLIALSVGGVYSQENNTEVATIPSTTVPVRRVIDIGELLRSQ